MSLLGRNLECNALDRLLQDALAGRSGVVTLRGDPGAGKSALLEYVAAQTYGWHTASATGVESEVELSYSGLHQLCSPLLDRLTRLPTPQHDALATVFGLAAGPAPERFLVGLATLTLLADVAEQKPMICVVDDAHWLDGASAQILGFVARRLLAERIAIVCAARRGIGDHVLAGLPELQLHGLGDADARALLLAHVNVPLDEAICDQIVAESHGNPLALLELPRTWSSAELAGGFGVLNGQPVAGKIERSYARRLVQLPTDTQILVLAAAAEPLGDPTLLQRAATTLGLDMKAADAAVDAGLLAVDGRVKFEHPLVRSAAYRAAAVEDRRRVHQALAEATTAATDPDRRAWHRAHATSEPDEEIAYELEQSADRAQARGGLAAAAAFLTRATELSPPGPARVHRALDAALANVQAATFEAARRMLSAARDGAVDELQRARVELVRAQLAFASARGSEATPLLLSAARRLEAVDPALARETYLDAFIAAILGSRVNEGVDMVDVADAARNAPSRPDLATTPGDLLLDAFGALTVDYATAVPVCETALRRLCDDQAVDERPRWRWHGMFIAIELWDDASWDLLSELHLQGARTSGALSELPVAITSRAFFLTLCGDLRGADGLVEELRSLSETTGVPDRPFGAAIVKAWRGTVDDATDVIAAAIREARLRFEGIGGAVAEYARAVLANSGGRYAEGLDAAGRAVRDHAQIGAENWGLAELVESATRSGRGDLAADAFERLRIKTQASGTDWARGVESRSRALLDGPDAEGSFKQAIEHLGRTRVRTELARAHLLYGEWLRRANRRVDARDELGVAHEMFSAMGAEGFAERTWRELSATGARVHRRSVDTRDDLTAQEAQISRLARDGLSNPEIGAQLFISSRTVEWHLRKVFTKLGISSRKDLRTALPDDPHAPRR